MGRYAVRPADDLEAFFSRQRRRCRDRCRAIERAAAAARRLLGETPDLVDTYPLRLPELGPRRRLDELDGEVQE